MTGACLCKMCWHSTQHTRCRFNSLCFQSFISLVDFISLQPCARRYVCVCVVWASAATAASILLWHFYRYTEFHSLSLTSFFISYFFSISVVSISHSLLCVCLCVLFFMSFSRLVSWCADIFVVTFIINWFVATNCFVRHGFHRFHSYFPGKKNEKRAKKPSCHKRFVYAQKFFSPCSFVRSFDCWQQQ